MRVFFTVAKARNPCAKHFRAALLHLLSGVSSRIRDLYPPSRAREVTTSPSPERAKQSVGWRGILASSDHHVRLSQRSLDTIRRQWGVSSARDDALFRKAPADSGSLRPNRPRGGAEWRPAGRTGARRSSRRGVPRLALPCRRGGRRRSAGSRRSPRGSSRSERRFRPRHRDR